jgi:glucosamine--fructose-6-phosphate aminotransferase (isomerizing)
MASLTKSLMFADALASAVSGAAVGIIDALTQVPSSIDRTIQEDANALADIGRSVADADRVFLVGAGPHFAAALTGAAKMLEAGYLPVMPQQLEEFAHEQMFLVEAGDPMFVVSAPGVSLARASEICEGAADLGARVFAVGVSREGFERSTIIANHGDFGRHEEVAAAASIAPLQLVAYHAAVARGADPDRMRHFDVNMRLIWQGRRVQALDEAG